MHHPLTLRGLCSSLALDSVTHSCLAAPAPPLFAWQNCETLACAAQQVREEGRPLVVSLLGASGNAELQHKHVWKVRDRAAGGGTLVAP